MINSNLYLKLKKGKDLKKKKPTNKNSTLICCLMNRVSIEDDEKILVMKVVMVT